MSLSDDLNRLHSRFTEARLRLMHYVALANLAIENQAQIESTMIAQLRSTVHASNSLETSPNHELALEQANFFAPSQKIFEKYSKLLGFSSV